MNWPRDSVGTIYIEMCSRSPTCSLSCKSNSFSFEKFCMKIRCGTEAQSISGMANSRGPNYYARCREMYYQFSSKIVKTI